MTQPVFLTRARLRTGVPAAAIRELLSPADDAKRIGAGHKLVWTLFADRPDRDRDFLWREADAGVYYLLSAREPVDLHGLFELDPPKLFAPAIGVGDRLRFSLRANATRAKHVEGQRRGKPCDVVMDALYSLPPAARAEARRDAVGTQGARWIVSQGERHGFVIPVRDDETPSVEVAAYRTVRIEHTGSRAKLGILDLEGVLEVRDPDTFLKAVVQGFGRAKAFGCGLMLVRRA